MTKTKDITLLSLIISFIFALKIYNFTDYPSFIFIYGIFLPIMNNRMKLIFEGYMLGFTLINVNEMFIKYQPMIEEMFRISLGYAKKEGLYFFYIAYILIRLRVGLAVWTYLLDKAGLYRRLK